MFLFFFVQVSLKKHMVNHESGPQAGGSKKKVGGEATVRLDSSMHKRQGKFSAC